MLTNILIGLLVYSVFMVLFLTGWMRWQNRMHAMDADMAKAFEEDCKARGK